MDYSSVSSVTHGEIVLSLGAPPLIQERVISNSKASYAQGPYGILIYQEIKASDFYVHYNIYQIEERFSFRVAGDSSSLLLCIALKNDFSLHLADTGEFAMREGQFLVASLAGAEATVTFETPGEYENLNIYLPVQYLDDYLSVFPFLNDFVTQAIQQKPASLSKEPGWISSRIAYVLQEFTECNYNEQVRRLYFDALMKELLLLLLLQTHKSSEDYHSLMQNLYEAKYVVEKNPAAHFTLREIADRVGLNEAKLKTGFKKVFGVEIGEFIIQAKMQKAYVWVVDTNKPFKEIAVLTGYTTLQNFATAFKRYFNATPGSVRKQFRHQ